MMCIKYFFYSIFAIFYILPANSYYTGTTVKNFISNQSSSKSTIQSNTPYVFYINKTVAFSGESAIEDIVNYVKTYMGKGSIVISKNGLNVLTVNKKIDLASLKNKLIELSCSNYDSNFYDACIKNGGSFSFNINKTEVDCFSILSQNPRFSLYGKQTWNSVINAYNNCKYTSCGLTDGSLFSYGETKTIKIKDDNYEFSFNSGVCNINKLEKECPCNKTNQYYNGSKCILNNQSIIVKNTLIQDAIQNVSVSKLNPTGKFGSGDYENCEVYEETSENYCQYFNTDDKAFQITGSSTVNVPIKLKDSISDIVEVSLARKNGWCTEMTNIKCYKKFGKAKFNWKSQECECITGYNLNKSNICE